MEITGRLHAPVALTLRKEPSVPLKLGEIGTKSWIKDRKIPDE
jgi:hypothetical protein